MKKFNEKIIHDLVMNPKRFWQRKINTFILILVGLFTTGYALGNYFSTEKTVKEYANAYTALESEIKLLSYSSDSLTTNLKINKLEAIADIKIPKSINNQHLDLMVVTAAYYDIPLRIFLRTAFKESTFNPNAISNKQAKGYFQIRDQTYQTYYKKIHIYDQTPESNIRLAGYILKSLKSKYKSWDLTLAAYNAGPKIVDSVGIPNYKETKNYIKFILL